MHELHTIIPDPDIILALEPEELGGALLLLLRAEGRAFHPNNIMMATLNDGDLSLGLSDPSRDRRQEISIAISEAFAWLSAQGLIVPKPGDTGGWLILSRRARSFESEEDVRQFKMARRLNRDLLHPTIAEKVWPAFVRGDFAEAVFTAMRSVEIAVRDAAAFPQKQVGTKLMQAAFGQSGPLRDLEADTAEEDGLMHLFIGAMGSYKNPHSHRNVALDDAGEAIEIVTLASHLLRIVDSRRPADRADQR